MADFEWESEVEVDDLSTQYYSITAGERNQYFMTLPRWHRSFFYSLRFQFRVEKSLDQLTNGGKRARELFENATYDRTKGLRHVMEIRSISEMIFPLVMFSLERRKLEEELVLCIAYEGMRAQGIEWNEIDLGCPEYEFKSLFPSDKNKIIENYAGLHVHIDDIEKMASIDAFSWQVEKHLKVWRYYLDERIASKLKLDKSKRKKRAKSEHEKWLRKAIVLWDNWDSFHHPMLNKTKTNIYEIIGLEVHRHKNTIRDAIREPFELYIKKSSV